jgi:hypothetical protein
VLSDKAQLGRHTFAVPDQDVIARIEGRTQVALEMSNKPIYFVCTVHPDQMYGALFPK